MMARQSLSGAIVVRKTTREFEFENAHCSSNLDSIERQAKGSDEDNSRPMPALLSQHRVVTWQQIPSTLQSVEQGKKDVRKVHQC